MTLSDLKNRVILISPNCPLIRSCTILKKTPPKISDHHGNTHLMSKTLKVFKWLVLLPTITLVVLVLVAPFYIYDRFNAEHPVAKLAFVHLSDQQYLAVLRTGDFCKKENFKIYGDQWQLDASFLRWKGLAVSLGFESMYRLDRLTGRYRSTDEQNSKPIVAYDIAPKVWFDLFADSQGKLLPEFLVDARFGSSVYLDIDPTLLFTVYRTEDALIAKSQTRPKTAVEDGMATIEINNACLKEPQFFAILAKKINQLAIQWL